jgi:tetraacyldisaccharide 4'-kinase
MHFLLAPFSLIYALVMSIRNYLYDNGWLRVTRVQAKVISVGNLTVGGTGKTPLIAWMAGEFSRKGKRTAILTRGYKGAVRDLREISI